MKQYPEIKATDRAWSFSHLKGLASCPMRLNETTFTKNWKEDGDSEVLQWGNEVHAAMDKRVSKGTALPLGMTHFDKYAYAVKKLPGDLQTELKLALNRDLKPTSFFSKDVWMRCVLDVVVVGKDKAWIIDWKTGKVNPDFMQLKIMGLAVLELLPKIPEVKASFIWLGDSTAAPDSFTVMRENKYELWKELNPHIRRLQRHHASGDFQPKPGRLCRSYCPVQSCAFHGR